MLFIKLHDKNSDIYRYDYISQEEKITVVAPSPAAADGIRKRSLLARPDLKFTSETIAKFVADELDKHDVEVNFYKKSRLMLELFSLWKPFFPDGRNDVFLQVFKLFTDLRGFTVNFDLAQEVLEKFPTESSKAITAFWRYMDERNICDEQGRYAALTQVYLASGSEKEQGEKENLAFCSFSNMSGAQIDLVKALAEKHDVYIPFNRRVYQDVRNSDWVSWLGSTKVKKKSFERAKPNLNFTEIREGLLSETLGAFLSTEKITSCDVILMQKSPSFLQIQEVALEGAFFKASVSTLEGAYIFVLNQIKKLFTNKEKIKTVQILTALKDMLEQENKKSFDTKNFRVIKVIQILYQGISGWLDLSKSNEDVSISDYGLIKSAFELDLPRNFISPLNRDQSDINVQGLESVEFLEPTGNTIVCVTKKPFNFDATDKSLPEDALEVLQSIGPIIRKELEVASLREAIFEVLSLGGHLFIDPDVLDSSTFWHEFIDFFNIKKVHIGVKKKERPKDFIKSLEKKRYFTERKWSASRVQRYIECPRKFYYQYVENIHRDPPDTDSLPPKVLGELEHKIIEKYMEKFSSFDLRAHRSLVEELLEMHLERENLVLDELEIQSARIELRDYSYHGIKFLFDFKALFSDAKFSFEVPVKQDDFQGKADCVIEHGDGFSLIDFKRTVSEGSGLTIKNVLEFEVIQLWYYLSKVLPASSTIHFMGYINLSDPQKSLVFVDEKSSLRNQPWEESLGIKIKSANIKSLTDEFEPFLQKKMSDILDDQEFLPTPKRKEVCRYCWVRSACLPETGVSLGG